MPDSGEAGDHPNLMAPVPTRYSGKRKETSMIAMVTPMFAAIGYSILYLLLGGGLGGAALIFVIAKSLGK